MTKKKIPTGYPFGIYRCSAILNFEEDIDLDHHMDRSDWEKLSDSKKEEKIKEIIEELCMSDIDYEVMSIAPINSIEK
jgi:copper chaperone CopZ